MRQSPTICGTRGNCKSAMVTGVAWCSRKTAENLGTRVTAIPLILALRFSFSLTSYAPLSPTSLLNWTSNARHLVVSTRCAEEALTVAGSEWSGHVCAGGVLTTPCSHMFLPARILSLHSLSCPEDSVLSLSPHSGSGTFGIGVSEWPCALYELSTVSVTAVMWSTVVPIWPATRTRAASRDGSQ